MFEEFRADSLLQTVIARRRALQTELENCSSVMLTAKCGVETRRGAFEIRCGDDIRTSSATVAYNLCSASKLAKVPLETTREMNSG